MVIYKYLVGSYTKERAGGSGRLGERTHFEIIPISLQRGSHSLETDRVPMHESGCKERAFSIYRTKFGDD